jgi:hypothetical protein
MSDLATVEQLAEFLADGGVGRLLAKSATVRADAAIAVAKTKALFKQGIDTLESWELVFQRLEELESIVKEA